MPGQLKIDIEPRRLLAVSELYVIYTVRGYSVALDVIDKKSKKEFYLFATAKSLSTALEQMRSDNNGRLKGCEFWIRKKTADKMSEYVVEE